MLRVQTTLHCCSLLWLKQAHVCDDTEKQRENEVSPVTPVSYSEYLLYESHMDIMLYCTCGQNVNYGVTGFMNLLYSGLSSTVRDSPGGPDPNPDCSTASVKDLRSA